METETMKRATVWEAVSELNSRTLFGRVVVNPPERRGDVKAFPTLDTWYFCKCGKAYQNVERYKEHKNAGGGCQKKISTKANKPKKVKNITIAKTDDETYEIVDMPEKKLPNRNRISNQQKSQISNQQKSRIANEQRSRISNEQKSRISNEQKSRISNELRSLISSEQKYRISNERKSRIADEHMSRLLKEPKSRNSNDLKSRILNDHKSRIAYDQKSRIPDYYKPRIPHDRSQQKIIGRKLKNTLAVTKPKPEVPRGIQGFVFSANPAQSTPAVQRSIKIRETKDLFECHKCGKVFDTLRTYRIHHTRMHVQVKTNSAVLSGSPTLNTVKHASTLTMTQDQLTSKPRIRQTVPVQKIVQRKAKCLKTKSMNMLMTKGGNVAVAGMRRCEFCNVDFTNSVSYFMHMRFKHEGKGILKCEHCSYKTVSQDGMEAHMKRFHKQRPTSFHLSLRSKGVDPESPATQNKEHLNGGGQTMAENVQMTDETEAVSARKIRKLRRTRLPKCYWCKMRFQSTSELLVHSAFAHPHPRSQRKSSTVLSIPAEEAILSTPAEEAVLNKPAEEAVLSDPALEATKISERLPTSSADLRSTLKETESIAKRISRCRHCSHRFENMTALNDHIKLAHPAKNLSLSNNIVSRRRVVKPILAPNEESANVQSRPRRSEVLRRVSKTPAGMPICTLCRKRFSSSKSLRLHMRTHFKKMRCEKCHRKFGTLGELDRHLATAHVTDGKFPCTLCTCNYRNSMGLSSHMWHHHRIRGIPANAEDKPADPPTSDEVALDDRNEARTQPESPSDNPPTTSQDEISGTLAVQRQEACGDQNEPDKVVIKNNTYNMCDGCEQWIPQAQIVRHKINAHGGGDFPCDKCSCVFRKSGSLSSHKFAMHRENTIKQLFIADQLGEKTQGSPRTKAVANIVEELPGTAEATSSLSSKTVQENVNTKRLSPLRSLFCRLCKLTVSGGVRGMLQHKKTTHPQSGAFKLATFKSSWAENLQVKSKAGGPISKANEDNNEKETRSFVQNLRARLEGNCKGAEPPAVRSQDLTQDSLTSTPNKQTSESIPQIISFFSQNANYVKQFSTPRSPPKIPSAFEKSKLIFQREVFKEKSKQAEKNTLNAFGKSATSRERLDVRSSEKTGKELIRRPVLKYMFGEERKDTSAQDIQSSIMKMRQNIPSSDNTVRKSRLFPPPPPPVRANSFDFKLPRYLEKKALALSNEVTLSRVVPNLMSPLPSKNINHEDASPVSNKQQQSTGLEFSRESMSLAEEDALNRLRGNNVSIFPVPQKGMSSSVEAPRSDQVLKPLAASSHVLFPNAGKTRLSMCHKCKKSFFNHSRLTEHLKSCQVQPAAGMKCGYCGNNFSQDLLIAHMKECGGKQLA